MTDKNFMSGNGGDFAGGGATGSWQDYLNQTAAETARLNRSGTPVNQSAAETARLNRSKTSENQSAAETARLNAYEHSANNIVTSSESLEKLNIQFQPNILDNYDAVTYHWKLFIVPDSITTSGRVLDVSNQTIIAESGVSDLTIDKVEMQAVTSPSVECGTGTMTNVKFEIVEPAGAGLIDKLFYQSIALGIGNWHTMPLYLQLEFRGRVPETSESVSTAPGAIGNMRWLWQLKMGTVKANVTTVGTRYDFETTLYHEFGQSNLIAGLKYNISLSKLEKFSDAMEELEDKFNAHELVMLATNTSIPDVYKIIVDPEIAGYSITPSTNNTNSIRSNDFVKFDIKSATFNVGTGVDKIIDSLLSTTREYQDSMIGAITPGASGSPMNAEVSQIRKFWRIITEARPLGFDKRRGTNAHEFTIFVVAYDLGILDSNTSQTANIPYTIEAQRRRLATYVKKSILKKKYNYIFTGLNDQIINFDLNMNYASGAAFSRLGGVYSNLAMADRGVITQNNAEDEAAVTEKLINAIALENNATTTNSASSKTAAADARNAINAAKLTDVTKSRYIKILDNAKKENRITYFRQLQDTGGADINGQISNSVFNATNLAKPVDNFQGTFISDVDINSKLAKDTYGNFLEATKGKLHPTAYYDMIQDKSVGLGIESNSNSGIQKLSSMFSVALHSGLDASMQKIKMTIKGDPFWLSPQPFSDTNYQLYNSLKPVSEAINIIKQGHYNITNSVNIYGSDNFIIIRFRTPRIFDTNENTEDGASAYNEVETFSGVYKVTNIVSKFEMGKFTHELACILDPEIRIIDFIRDIEDNAKTRDIPTTVQDMTTIRNLIPNTAVKSQKILGANPSTEYIATSAGNIQLTGTNIPTTLQNPLPGLPDIIG